MSSSVQVYVPEAVKSVLHKEYCGARKLVPVAEMYVLGSHTILYLTRVPFVRLWVFVFSAVPSVETSRYSSEAENRSRIHPVSDAPDKAITVPLCYSLR